MPPASHDLKGRQMSSKKPVPGYIWLLAGLVIGLFVAFLVYLGKQPVQETSFTEAVKQELKKARDAQQQAEEKAETRKAQGDKGGENESRPRFEFYTILSELEVFVPEPEADAPGKTSPPASAPVSSATGKRYLLQAGSFRSRPDAEGLKASLALLGVSSSVQSVKINGDDWHRVRIGPFDNPTNLRDTEYP